MNFQPKYSRGIARAYAATWCHFLLVSFFLVPWSQALAGRRAAKYETSPSGMGFGNNSRKQKPKQPTAVPYTADTSETTQRLLEFLESEECEGYEVTEVGFSNSQQGSLPLRGVFAKEQIQPGEYICAIPFVSTLLVDETFFEDAEASDQKRLSAARLENAVKFLEKFGNEEENKKWKPYLDCIPGSSSDPNFDATPDFWLDEDINQLEVPELVDEMFSRKRGLQQIANENNSLDLDLLQHASWAVRTRAFTTLKKAIALDGTEGLLQRTVLIPYLDFINHDSKQPNAELQVIETKEYDESFYALSATCPIARGTEIKIAYGIEETSLELFGNYGFLPLDNEQHDQQLLQGLRSLKWSTSLEEDLVTLTDEAIPSTTKLALSLRVYLKELQKQGGVM